MYIIKTHYEATEANKNFAGEIHDWYSGKGGERLGAKDTFPCAWEIAKYGYKALAPARRGLQAAQSMAEWETGHGYWVVTAEILEIN